MSTEVPNQRLGADGKTTVAALVQGYGRDPHLHDELLGGDGVLRPHWRGFLEALVGVPEDELTGWPERLNALVRDTGIAHDIFADPGTRERWRVDPLPLLIPAAEWQSLQAALVQRARLFEAILADIYGGQELLLSGRIPPGLVFSDPAWLRDCRGIEPPRRLMFYA